MDGIKFLLRGRTAFFKKPDVNTYLYFTYGNVHKIALLGIIGAAMGFKGYTFQDEKTYPEFYEKLKDLKFSVVPDNNPGGFIPKKIQTFNNSVGYASQESGGNLVVTEQWLENPSWEIYILIDDNPYIDEIKDRLLNGKFVYLPYLGKNDHFADILDTKLVKLEEVSDFDRLDSLFLKDYFEILDKADAFTGIFNEDYKEEKLWKYEEKLPEKLDENTNQYITKRYVFTNMNVKPKKKCPVFSDGNKNLFFS